MSDAPQPDALPQEIERAADAAVRELESLLEQLLAQCGAAAEPVVRTQRAVRALQAVGAQVAAGALVGGADLDAEARRAVRRTLLVLRHAMHEHPGPTDVADGLDSIVEGLEYADEAFMALDRGAQQRGRPPVTGPQGLSWVAAAQWLLDVSDTPVTSTDVATFFYGTPRFPAGSGHAGAKRALSTLAGRGEARQLGPRAGWRPAAAVG